MKGLKFLLLILVFILNIAELKAQVKSFKDLSESLLGNINRGIIFPGHPNDIFCPRLKFNIEEETITIEHALTKLKEVHSYIDVLKYNTLDTFAAKPYPKKVYFDWGGAQQVIIGKGFGFTRNELQKINAIFGNNKDIIAFVEKDLNANGIMDYLIVRRVDSPTYHSEFSVNDSVSKKGYEVEVYEGSIEKLSFIARFYFPLYTHKMYYYTNAKDKRLNILTYQVYDTKVGAFQIGVDSIFW